MVTLVSLRAFSASRLALVPARNVFGAVPCPPAALGPFPASHAHQGCRRAACAAAGAAVWHGSAPPPPRRQRSGLLPPAASYSVVTGSEGGSAPKAQPLRLIIYSKEGCHLCEGLKEKVEALLDRAAFMPCSLSAAELEVRDITTDPQWEARYAMTIPVLAVAAPDGSGEAEVPRPSPRLSADALQKHIEKFLAAQQQQAGA